MIPKIRIINHNFPWVYTSLIYVYRSKLSTQKIEWSILSIDNNLWFLTHTHMLTNPCPIIRSILHLPRRVSLGPLLLSSKKPSKDLFLWRMFKSRNAIPWNTGLQKRIPRIYSILWYIHVYIYIYIYMFIYTHIIIHTNANPYNIKKYDNKVHILWSAYYHPPYLGQFTLKLIIVQQQFWTLSRCPHQGTGRHVSIWEDLPQEIGFHLPKK